MATTTTTMTTIQALRLLQLNACTIEALLEATTTSETTTDELLDLLPEEQIRMRLKATEVLFLSMSDQYFGEAPFYEAWTAKIAGWWKRLETLVQLKEKQKERKEEYSCSSGFLSAFFSSSVSTTSEYSSFSNSSSSLKNRANVEMVDASTSTSTDDLDLPKTILPNDSNDQTEVKDSLQLLPSSHDVIQVLIEPAETEIKAEEVLDIDEPPRAFKLKSVKCKVEEEIAALPPLSSETDIVGLRTLLLTLSTLIKDRRLTDQFKGRLLSKHLLPKLPSNIVEKYRRSGPRGDFGLRQRGDNAWKPNKMALLHLRHYLGDHLLEIFARSPPAAHMLAITEAGEVKKEAEKEEVKMNEEELKSSPGSTTFREVSTEELKQLKTLMVAELAPLPPVTGADDLSSLEALLATVASVRQLLRLFCTQSLPPESPSSLEIPPPSVLSKQERALEEALYDVLAGKLPEALRQQEERADRLCRKSSNQMVPIYNGGLDKSLSTLSRMLTRLISDHYRRKDIERRQQQKSASHGLYLVPQGQQLSISTSTSFGQHHARRLLCTYCKEVGHRTLDCALPKSMLCYRCFKVGHKAKNCPEPPEQWRHYGSASLPAVTAANFDRLSLHLEEAYKGKGKIVVKEKEKVEKGIMIATSAIRLENGQLFGPREGLVGQQLCLECVTFGHRTADCRQVVCFRCKQPGHMRSSCPNQVDAFYFPATPLPHELS